jgi:hypothetical protein
VDLVSRIFVPGIRLLLCSAWVGRDQDKQGRKGEDRSGQADHGQRFLEARSVDEINEAA